MITFNCLYVWPQRGIRKLVLSSKKSTEFTWYLFTYVLMGLA